MNASDSMHGGGAAFYLGTGMPFVLAQSKPTSAAAATGATPPPGGIGGILDSPLIPVLLIGAIFMIMMSRSNKKKQSAKQAMLDNMKRGDRVQTIGGILGTVVEAREKDVIVKVDEGNNTKIKFARGAIDRIVEEDKA